MKCGLNFDKLLSFSLGELDEKEAESVHLHLGRCPDCRRELEAIDRLSSGLSSLPEVQPDDRSWASLRDSLEREQAESIAFTLWFIRLVRRPLVAGSLFLLAASIGALFLMRAQRGGDPEMHVGVEEMGSIIAHRDLSDDDLRNAMELYLNDSEKIVEESLICADSGDAARWRSLKRHVASRDMLYRALYLREKIPGPELGQGVYREGKAGHLALIEDSIRLLRAIDEHSPEALARDGERIEKEIGKLDLLNRLGKEGYR